MADTIERLGDVQGGNVELAKLISSFQDDGCQHSNVFATSVIKATLPQVYQPGAAKALGEDFV
jgi:hypothetical protein